MAIISGLVLVGAGMTRFLDGSTLFLAPSEPGRPELAFARGERGELILRVGREAACSVSSIELYPNSAAELEQRSPVWEVARLPGGCIDGSGSFVIGSTPKGFRQTVALDQPVPETGWIAVSSGCIISRGPIPSSGDEVSGDVVMTGGDVLSSEEFEQGSRDFDPCPGPRFAWSGVVLVCMGTAMIGLGVRLPRAQTRFRALWRRPRRRAKNPQRMISTKRPGRDRSRSGMPKLQAILPVSALALVTSCGPNGQADAVRAAPKALGISDTAEVCASKHFAWSTSIRAVPIMKELANGEGESAGDVVIHEVMIRSGASWSWESESVQETETEDGLPAGERAITALSKVAMLKLEGRLYARLNEENWLAIEDPPSDETIAGSPVVVHFCPLDLVEAMGPSGWKLAPEQDPGSGHTRFDGQDGSTLVLKSGETGDLVGFDILIPRSWEKYTESESINGSAIANATLPPPPAGSVRKVTWEEFTGEFLERLMAGPR